MPARRTRLSLQALESRTTPAAVPWPADAFDQAVVGSIPADWSGWAADGDSGFRVSNTKAVAGNALSSAGGSTRAGRVWLGPALPADVSATAAVLADTLIPAQVFVRGTNLDTPRPSYYAASVVRGTEVTLLRVRDGTATELGFLRTNTYLSGVWLDVSLMARGDAVQVRVRRRDTGAWLTPFGDWQANPAAAITVRGAGIPAGGQVGLARPASYAGTIYFDEVRVGPAPADLVPPAVTALARNTVMPAKPNTLGGVVRFSVVVQEAGGIDRTEFYVDGALAARYPAGTFAHYFDTRNLPNALHTLSVRVWDKAGNVGASTVPFQVYNRNTVPRPDLPRHFDHIRFAALAYNGNPMGPTEQQLLRDAVDLVVPNVRYLDTIDKVSPATPQLVYSNVSNLYLDLLTDWLNYADRTMRPREAAFYHVAQPTPFSGDSPSSLPVTWFWNVQRGPSSGATGFTALTTESRTGANGGVPFGGTGQAVYAAFPERFREVNLSLSRGAGSGWAGVVEYPSLIDAAGRPTAWRTMKLTGDTSNGLRQSGTLTFDPPADWRPAVVPGSTARLFYVRFRTTAGDAAPVAATILGRDYVGANGARSGVIPAFDTIADRDKNGYLSDAEYAKRRPGFDARFSYESRLFYPAYGQMRFVTNPAGVGVAAWAADYHRRLLAANPKADGLFMDNSGGRAPTDRAVLVELTDTYATDYGAVLGAVNRAIAPRWVLANTSGGGTDADRVARQVPASIEEFALRPLGHNWVQFRDLADTVARRLTLADPPGYLVLDSLSTGGSPTDPRTRMSALAYYYLLADPDATLFMTWGGEEPASAWDRHWFDAIRFDVGRPKGPWAEWASGADPANAALTYRVYARGYDNALVLYKPLSYAAGKGTGTPADATATTHQLDGAYRALNADGTLGPVATSVTLRNGEGAVLVRA